MATITTYSFKGKQQLVQEIAPVIPQAEAAIDYIISIWDFHQTKVVRLHSGLLRAVIGKSYSYLISVLKEKNILKVVSRPIDGVMATGYVLGNFEKEKKEKKNNPFLDLLFDSSKSYKQNGINEAKQAMIQKYQAWIDAVELEITEEEKKQYSPAQQKAITDIENKKLWVKCDDFSGRIHTSITMLPKEVRSKIKIDGEEVVEVDIKSSFAQKLFHISNVFNCDEEFQKQVQKGDVYKYIAYHLGVDRGQAKKLFNITLNSKAGGYQHKGLIKLFPALFRASEALKDMYGYKVIAEILQKAELRDMMGISAELAAMGVKHFTIHDSILCKKLDEAKVKQVFLAHNLKVNL